jgi:hypothetical protein
VREARQTIAIPPADARAPRWKAGARRDATVELAVEALGADLSGEVDQEGLGHRHHPWRAGNDDRVADVVDRVEGKAGIVVDEVVEPARAHREAGHDRPGYDARRDEVRHRLRDHVRMDRELASVGQVSQHLIRDTAQADLERRAIVDEPSDVPCNLLCHVVRRLVQVLDHRGVDLDEAVDAADGNPAVSTGPRHRWVDLGNDRAGSKSSRVGHVHGGPEAARAVRVGRSDLHQRDVERHPAASDQPGHVGERQWQVLDGAGVEQGLDVTADVEHAVPVVGRRRFADADPVGEEMHQLDALRRPVELLERLNEGSRRRARAPDEDSVARTDE